MAASTQAFFLFPPGPGLGAGHINPPSSGVEPENSPAILWGQGTPAAIPPFTTVNKGSLYMQTNTTDDEPAVWQKVDEGGDTADWVEMLVDEDEGGNVFVVRSDLIDISAADSEEVVFHAVSACTILEAGLIWNEATATSGAAEGDVTIGTASGGAQIVTATSYDVSKSSGDYQALTLASGALAAGTSVFMSHDQASGAAGTYYAQFKIRIDN